MRSFAGQVVLIFVALLLGSTSGWCAPSIANAGETPAMDGGAAVAHARARMIADTKSVQPGKPFKLGIELTMDPGWHTYYKDPGDAGMPTKIEWQLPVGFTHSDLLWERPNKFDETGIVTYGYQDKVLLASVITPPDNLTVGSTLEFSAKVKWLTCKEICIPGKGSSSIKLPVTAAGATAEKDNQDAFAKANFNGSVKSLGQAGSSGDTTASSASGTGSNPTSSSEATTSGTTPATTSNTSSTSQSTASDAAAPGSAEAAILATKYTLPESEQSQSLLAALGLALLGGFVLNFMPCVLPVIAIKILSFLEQAHDEPKRVRLLGLTFAAGITSTFLFLAGLALGIQAAGQQVGWGFQFQYPGFIVAMAVVVLLLALSLFGMFFVSVDAGNNKLNSLAGKEGFTGTFFKGVLATVLSTPCTAPFLGTALGFAFTQNPLSVLAIFFTIGLGMSLPYLVLSAKPEWMRFIPKPGDWMEKLKESFGFILLATVVWLLYVLGSEAGVDAVIWTSAFLVAVSFAAWIVSRFTDLSSDSSRKFKVWSISAVVVLVSFYFFIATKPGIGFLAEARTAPPVNNQAVGVASVSEVANGNGTSIDWQPFTFDKLQDAFHQNRTVLVDFTAQWCLTCKVNEQGVLSSQAVIEKLKALKVTTLRADWTNQEASITKLLHKFNRSGVPLYVIYPPGKSDAPIVLPEVITEGMVLSDLDQAGASK